MEVIAQEEVITRTALGRFGVVGELYNARTECLSSRSLFKSSLPSTMTKCQDINRMDFEYKFVETISDLFDLIKIEGELQIGALCGFITLKGSGEFFSDEKKSEKIVSCSLVCKLQTVCEKIYGAWEEIAQHIDMTALKDTENTHVIVECYWGANCYLNVESCCESDSKKQEVKGLLGTEMSCLGKLVKAKVEGKMGKESGNFSRQIDCKIRVNADIIPKEGFPTSIEEFYVFMLELPKMLRNVNGGKGKPLNYAMVPLSTIRRLAKIDCAFDSLVVQISESFLISTVGFFDEIATIKRKFYDHLRKLEKYKKYINEDDYQTSKARNDYLHIKESELKRIISDKWPFVRSGGISLTELIKIVEAFKEEMKLIDYEKYVYSNEAKYDKLSSIDNCLSKGIFYLGRRETFADLLGQNPSSDFMVFVTSEKTRESQVSQETFLHFLMLAENPILNYKYVVIDLDYGTTFLDGKIEAPKCLHLKGSRIISADVYGEYKLNLDTNFALLKEDSNWEYVTHKPGSRVPLEMPCPNSQKGVCNPGIVKWSCFRCKNTIEYGFGFFYCCCGRCRTSLFTFKCKDPKHGDVFVAPEEKFLEETLSNLRVRKEINILVVGQSGVGKSTWINSIFNYLTYETFEDALKGEQICIIPSSIQMFSPRSKGMVTVSVGEERKEENTKPGASATRCCHCYSFFWQDRLVRLIDTPGLGDTRGIQQDKWNLQNLINFTTNLKELHVVCLLFKSSENRFNSFFEYCLKELLVHFHKDVTKNIIFCFTFASNKSYNHGPVVSMLENIFNTFPTNIEQNLSLGPENMFFLDNVCFDFLCAQKCSQFQLSDDIEDYVKSWNWSQEETKRFFDTVKHFKPHSLLQTKKLFDARRRVLWLTQILAEISKTIQLNITAMQEKRKEIESSKKTLEDLERMVAFTEVQLEPERLIHPRTVCTAPSCVNYISYRYLNVTEIEYKTHCHEQCYVRNVELNAVNNCRLRLCQAMKSDGTCNICGCRWEQHMHIKFQQRRVEKQVRNKNIEEIIKQNMSEREMVEHFLEELASIIQEYEKEQQFVIQATAKFAIFLKHNAIAIYNDRTALYLQYLIEEQENKPYKSESDHRLLRDMKENLERYKEEVKIFENLLDGTEQTKDITIEDIYKLEEDLRKLNFTGKGIENITNVSGENCPFEETHIQFKKQPPRVNGLVRNIIEKAGILYRKFLN